MSMLHSSLPFSCRADNFPSMVLTMVRDLKEVAWRIHVHVCKFLFWNNECQSKNVRPHKCLLPRLLRLTLHCSACSLGGLWGLHFQGSLALVGRPQLREQQRPQIYPPTESAASVLTFLRVKSSPQLHDVMPLVSFLLCQLFTSPQTSTCHITWPGLRTRWLVLVG